MTRQGDIEAQASPTPRLRLAVLSSHPIQYYAPLFRGLAADFDLHVFFAHRATPQQQAAAGFGTAFEWDVDLTTGYANSFLQNRSPRPGTDHFSGCDTPEIGARLREGGFDALLVFGWHLKSCIQAVVAAKWLSLPVIVRGDSHLATPRSLMKRLAKSLTYPLLLRLFDAACFVGHRSKAYYVHYGYPRNRLFFSPHCIDSAWFGAQIDNGTRHRLRQKLGLTEQQKVVLFAGKLLPFKRPLDVAEACARLRSRGVDVTMMIAGSGQLDGELRDTAARSGLPLRALGFRNQTEMPAVYAAADVLMLPSDARETWGLVCNEALACGTPIVVSEAVGCAPDLAADGAVGRTFALGDIDQAVEQLHAVLSTPPDRAAIAHISNSYSIAAAVDGVVQAVNTTVRRHGTRQRMDHGG